MAAPEQTSQLRVRPRKSYLWGGFLSIAMAGGLSTVALYGHFVDGGAVELLIPVLVMSSLWVFLGAYLVAAQLRGYCEVNEREILQQGVLKSRQIPLRELKTVRWKWPGTIVLRSESEKITIDPRGFDRGSTLPLIELLRERTKHAEHIGWPEYVHQFALPMRKKSVATRDDMNDETHIWSTRKRMDIFMGGVSVLFALIGVATAVVLQQWRFLTAAFPMLVLWGVLRFSTPKDGEPQPRIKSQCDSKYITWMVYWGLANAVGVGIANVMGAMVDPVLAVWVVIAVVGLIYLGFKGDQDRAQVIRDKAPDSLKEWEHDGVIPK